jgi:hypothetical protein
MIGKGVKLPYFLIEWRRLMVNEKFGFAKRSIQQG